MRKMIELEDVESALYALQRAREPMVKFSPSWEETKDRGIAAMQQGIDQALKCLERICNEANRDKS